MKLDNSRYDGGNTDVDRSEIWYRRGTLEKIRTTASNQTQYTAISLRHVVRVTLLVHSRRLKTVGVGQRVRAEGIGHSCGHSRGLR
uniref:Uncharacterized protein n=1 Tax=Moniliophthora roreri TaxID=221103 RepID=A0A0W0G3P0_MONRR